MRDDIKIIDLDLDMKDESAKAVALGNFDGIHKGHQKLMRENIKIAKEKGLVPSVLLFKENTRETLNKKIDYLTSLDDKIEILADLGIKCFLIIHFDDKFRSMNPYKFIKEILHNKLNAKYITVGSDYRFGDKASGNIDTLREYEDEFSYKTQVVDFAKTNGEKISSRTIRQLIKDGKIKEANEFLDRPYRIKGKVVHGYKRGRELNFPTANLDPSFSYCIPKDGVYLTKLTVHGKSHYALTNIGTNPTFENLERKVETYILDFDEYIYDEDISIDFLEFFRGDFKFSSVDELIEQMEKDKKMAYDAIKNRAAAK